MGVGEDTGLKLSPSRLCREQLWIPSVLMVRPTQSHHRFAVGSGRAGCLFLKLFLVSTPEYNMAVPKGNRRPLTKLGEQTYRYTN